MSKKKDIVIDYLQTGNCLIDIEEAIKQWNEKFFIAQWGDDIYRLIIYRRLGYSATNLKVNISLSQAKELIEKIPLICSPSLFTSGKSWNYVSDDSFVYGLFPVAKHLIKKIKMSDYIDYSDKTYILNRLSEIEKKPKEFKKLIKKYHPQYYCSFDDSIAAINLSKDLKLI